MRTRLALLMTLLLVLSISLAVESRHDLGESAVGFSPDEQSFEPARTAATSRLWAVIDRFEGNQGVVFFGDCHYTVDLPEHFLPAEVTEGAILRVHFEVDWAETERRRAKMEERADSLK